MEKKESLLSLMAKERIAKAVIEDALTSYVRPAILWSGGKDSTVVLHLVKEVTAKLGLKLPPVLFVDHGDHFPETMQLISEVSKKWVFNVVVAKNEDILNHVNGGRIYINDLSEENQKEARRIGFSEDSFPYSLETNVCSYLLKTVPMNSVISRYRFDALFTGVRWDENPDRCTEVFISSRENPHHVRIQPILPMLEKDIWEYILANKLPVHPKYQEGYRSINGMHDSKKVSNLPAWEQVLGGTSERTERSQDEEDVKERLREWGYI